MLNLDEYNGNLDDESALSLSLSLSERHINQFTPLCQFKQLVATNRLREAAKLYYQSESIQPLLQQFMSELPWKIACEYDFRKGQLDWFRSWIQLGWGPSPNPSGEYYTTTLEGSSNLGIEIILNRVSVFLSRITPTSPFYLIQLEPFYDSDLLLSPTVEVGSIEPVPVTNPDGFAHPTFYLNNLNQTRNTWYVGVKNDVQ